MTTAAGADDASGRTTPRCGGVDVERDRRSVAAWRQTRLNDIVLAEARRARVSREDHRLMLRQLVSAAYHRDPNRRANIGRWKGIMLAVEKEFLGANALLTLAPDPHQVVLAKLSSMMLWHAEACHWTYGYCTSEIERRRLHHLQVLTQLKQSGKMFLTG